jgi:hypothetical protein
MVDDLSRPRILTLWSVPRSRSTAFFRAMVERGDFQGCHEPFSYLAEFGKCEVNGRTVTTEPALIDGLREWAREKPVFVKDTTDESYPGVLADERFLRADAVHTFLIRHPARTIASYQAINPAVQRHQIGFESLYAIYEAVAAATGRPPLVLDGDDFAARPQQMMAAYCAEVGIPFETGALSWQSGERSEWAPSARWHRDASESSGVHARTNDYGIDVAGDPVLGEYLRYHLPFYEKLRAHARTV